MQSYYEYVELKIPVGKLTTRKELPFNLLNLVTMEDTGLLSLPLSLTWEARSKTTGKKADKIAFNLKEVGETRIKDSQCNHLFKPHDGVRAKKSPSQTLLHWAKVKLKSFSRVRFFMTPWTVTYQAPPIMGFSRQKFWSRLLFPSPGIFQTQGSNLGLLHCRQTLLPSLSHLGRWWLAKAITYAVAYFACFCYYGRDDIPSSPICFLGIISAAVGDESYRIRVRQIWGISPKTGKGLGYYGFR